MKPRRGLVFWLMVIACGIVSPAWAQDCGSGLPCGPLPWSLPNLPNLVSPTPFLVENVTNTPAPTPTGTITVTPTPTQDLSMDELSDQLGTLQSIVSGTQFAATEEPGAFTVENVGETLPIFFRFTHWIRDFRFGVFTPMTQVLVFAFFSALLLGLLNLLLPLFAPLIGLMRWAFDLLSKLAQLVAQAIQIIVQFIRG